MPDSSPSSRRFDRSSLTRRASSHAKARSTSPRRNLESTELTSASEQRLGVSPPLLRDFNSVRECKAARAAGLSSRA